MRAPMPEHRTLATVAVLLAAGAAVLLASSSVLTAQAAAAVPLEATGTAGLLWRLLRAPRWWAGRAAGIAGFGLHVAALRHGALLVVEPVVACGLLVAVGWSARVARRGVRRELAWAVLLVAGIAALLVAGAPVEGTAAPPAVTWALAAAVAGAVAGGAAALARRRRGAGRAVLLAASAGTIYGALDALLDRLADVVQTAPDLLRWEAAAAAALIVVGAAVVARAFQAAHLAAALPTLTLSEPVVAALLGAVLFGDRLGADGAGRAIAGLGALAAAGAAAALARSPALAAPAQV